MTRNEKESNSKKNNPVIWKSYLQILKHSSLGWLRAFLLSVSIKGGVAFFLSIIRLASSKQKKSSMGTLIFNAAKLAFGGADTMRFASAVSSFAFLWKLINNSLMLYFNHTLPSKRFGAIAGGIAASVAILFESKTNRVGYSQQFFVRSMQAFVNARKFRGLPTVKNGDSLVFILSCGWILYAFCFRQGTLPRVYLKWLSDRAGIPSTSLDLHRIHACNSFQLTSKQEVVLDTIGISENNLSRLHECIKRTDGKLKEFPCLFFHPLSDSCSGHCFHLFFRNVREMAPVYFSLNAIPMAIFNPSRFFQNTGKQMYRILESTLTSSVFISSLITTLQAGLCLYTRKFPTWKTKNFIIPLTLVSASWIFLEQKKKRAELALFVFPKALQSLYLTMVEKNFLVDIPGLEVVSSGFSMAIIMSLYQVEPENISSLLYKVMKQVLGTY